MKRFILAAATAALALSGPLAAAAQTAAPPAAQPAAIPIADQERCAALFALVVADQHRKAPGADRFPDLDQRGKEFFVATGLRLLNDEKVPADQLEPRIRATVAKLQGEIAAAPDPKAKVDAEMTKCMPMLDQVHLPPEARQEG